MNGCKETFKFYVPHFLFDMFIMQMTLNPLHLWNVFHQCIMLYPSLLDHLNVLKLPSLYSIFHYL